METDSAQQNIRDLKKDQRHAQQLKKLGIPDEDAGNLAALVPPSGRIWVGSPVRWMSKAEALQDKRIGIISEFLFNPNGGQGEELFSKKLLAIAQSFRPGGSSLGKDQSTSAEIPFSPRLDDADWILSVVAQANTVEMAMQLIIKSGFHPGGFVLLCRLAELQTSVGRTCKCFTESIKRLAGDFGLRPTRPDDEWWAYHYLHFLVSQASQEMDDGAEPSLAQQQPHAIAFPSLWLRLPEKNFKIQWNIGQCSLGKENVEAYILGVFRQQWDEATQILQDHDYSISNEKQMHRHVHWLYLAICPNGHLDRPLTYQEIANVASIGVEGLDTSTATKAVGRLAKELGIDIAKRRGRPKHGEIVNSE